MEISADKPTVIPVTYLTLGILSSGLQMQTTAFFVSSSFPAMSIVSLVYKDLIFCLFGKERESIAEKRED